MPDSKAMERLGGQHELLDGPLDADVLAGNLRDMARVNRWLGGVSLSRKAVLSLLRGRSGPVDMLDVGTGAADIPDALIRWFDHRNRLLRVTAIDRKPEILALARSRTSATPDRLRLLQVETDQLPFEDAAFDVAHCSMVVHHTEPEEAAALLAEMARVSRLGFVVNDLDRSQIHWLGARALSMVATRNAYTRNDGPLSVRRAYRAAEIAQMAARMGWLEQARFVDPLRYRYAMAFVKARQLESSAERA